MSDVPPEIISAIFSRLPVKSLLRFRCVSKPFCDLIDSSDFIKSHLNHSLKFNTNRSIIVGRSGGLHSIDIDSLDKAVKLNCYEFKVVGTCNGLVCLSAGEEICLFNPSTHDHIKLPFNEIEYPEKPMWIIIHTVVYGFGYDSVNDDYKVVRITQFVDQVEELVMDVNEVKVYSLKSNSWQKIGDFPYLFYNKTKNGVLVNGALHWIVMVRPKEEEGRVSWSDKIVAFDIATEEYTLISLPDYTPCKDGEMVSYDPDTEEYHVIPNEMVMRLRELGGKLCLECNYKKRYIDIWVMNYYGIVDSWTKLCSVAQPYDSRRSEYLKAVAYSKNGEELLLEQEGGRLVWYNLRLETVVNIRIPDSPHVFKPYVYTDTLTKLTSAVFRKPKLNSGARTNVPHQQKEEANRKTQPKRDNFLSKGFKLKL